MDFDVIVLSHGHSDHTVATVEVTEMSGGCKVYARPHAFYLDFTSQKREREPQEGTNAMSLLYRDFREKFAVNFGGRVFKSEEKPHQGYCIYHGCSFILSIHER